MAGINDLINVDVLAEKLNKRLRAELEQLDPGNKRTATLMSAQVLKDAINDTNPAHRLAGRKVGHLYLTTEAAVVDWVLRQPGTKEQE